MTLEFVCTFTTNPVFAAEIALGGLHGGGE
jgi:hypothetical protein